MRPSDFLATATELQSTTEERRLRAAVHAAYYGVYHVVAAHFDRDPAAYEAKHSDLGQLLGGLRDPSKVPPHIWTAKRWFKDLKAARRQADYVLTDPLDPDEADELVEAAKAIIPVT